MRSGTTRVCEQIQHTTSGKLAHFICIDLDGCQWWVAESAETDIVEANDGNIAGQAPVLSQNLHGGESCRIVDSEHPGQVRNGRECLLYQCFACFKRRRCRVKNE